MTDGGSSLIGVLDSCKGGRYLYRQFWTRLLGAWTGIMIHVLCVSSFDEKYVNYLLLCNNTTMNLVA